jgi:hypothetical protein
MIDRRSLIAAGPALLAVPALAAPSKDVAVRGSKAYSESAMVMSVTPDGLSALTLRFCRFPVEGQTWVWCHVFHEGRFYAFTNHDLPCSADRLAGTQLAEYRAPGVDAELVRVRRGGKLPAVRLAADLTFHESRSAPHGAGDVPGKFSAQFLAVSPLGAQVLEGRDEVYGWCSAQVEIGGRRFVHEGLAKFHEQRQEAARFEAPFCYSFLSGDSMNCTALLHAKGASGGWQIDGVETALADMTLDRPGRTRAVSWKMRDKPALPGRLAALVRYEIPIYDRRWNGSFVQGVCDGRPIVGAMNDWIAEPDIYAAASARASQS